MVLPPDHADRVINQHRTRVEKVAMLGTLILIASAGWWLLPATDGSVEMLPRMGPVIAIFVSSLLLMDLIDYGPIQRARIAVTAGLAWPMVLALCLDSIGSGDRAIATMVMFIIAFSLARYWNDSLSNNLTSRRLRGLSALAGAAFAVAIAFSLEIRYEFVLVAAIPSLFIGLRDLTLKDDNYDSRQEFSNRLREAQIWMLQMRADNSGLEQAASLIQQANEKGWKDPARGMILIEEAEREAERVIAMSFDIDAIRSDCLICVERAEAIAPSAEGPRRAFEMGDREAELGSLREAEILYRLAKTKSTAIEEHWLNAVKEIEKAEEAIYGRSGSVYDSVLGIIRAAREALESEEPEEALHIANAIPGHLDSLESTIEEAASSIKEAEEALSSVDEQLLLSKADRLNEAKEAFSRGDSPLAKGLADSLIREIRDTSDAMTEVQRALRQKKQIHSRFPSGSVGEVWNERLKEIEKLASLGEWNSASESLKNLTLDLQVFESERSDANELLEFLEGEWNNLRRRLDSSGIGVADESRINAEKSVNMAREHLEKGEIQDCLKSLGLADEIIENLSRRV
tara:strand:+ start:8110 stop:9828 length:1719 start_codon:yes stop_codon:yes gene_type:complete